MVASLELAPEQSVRLVDVGARWGANPPWDQLEARYVTYLGFEPDAEEYRRLIERRASARIDYLPVGLSDVAEDQTLHITREPGCSSAFQPNHSLLQKFFLSERWDVQQTVPIKTVPLADVLRERGFVPDVLKIDVQGAALKVLRGAGDYLDDVLVVDVEVEFCEMYRGGALFADVDVLLRAHGFELLDLDKHYARRRILGHGHSSRGQVLFADALYVKSAERFFGKGELPEVMTARLCNLILILALYGHFDVALEFAFHARSPLTLKRRAALQAAIDRCTRLSPLRSALANPVVEKVGLLLALIGNTLRMRSRTLGWGSDHEAVDDRYKYFFSHPLLKMFRR